MPIEKLPSSISQATAHTIMQVLNVFETGTKEGKYDGYVEYEDFTYKGKNYYQITYGKSQTTEFGNLKRLLQMYVDAKGKFANDIAPYLPLLGTIKGDKPQSLWTNEAFETLLKRAGKEDKVMHEIQDIFFERYYFQPALGWFLHHGFQLPLSLLVIYDSQIHSGGIFDFLRQRFSEVPPAMGGNEKQWIAQYVNVRHDWLKNHSKPVVRMSKYRTATLKELTATDNWQLDKPFVTQGVSFP